jgi:L-alanine-DL-glutamate epimerase-like enolase superfamily enzyme
MTPLSRRSFLAKSAVATAGLATLGHQTNARVAPGNRHHPLDGIEPDNIKITDITVTPLSYVDRSLNLWRHVRYIVWKTDAALVRIYTNQGVIGIGEANPYAGPDRIKKFTEEVLKPMLVGKNPFDVLRRPPNLEDARTRWAAKYPESGYGNRIPTASWAGLDNALWDIIGKVKNKPVYELLSVDGNSQPRIRMYASGGVEHEWYNNGEEFLITEALRYQAMGFDAFKLRTGTEWAYSNMTLEKYMPIMERLSEAVGPDFRLIHETMGPTGVSLDRVVDEFCPLLDDLGFHWFEDPMGGMEGYARIAKKLKHLPVSGGAGMLTAEDNLPWVESGAFEIVQADCNTCGITEAWRISRQADAFGLPHCPHNWHGGLTTMSNAHLVAAIPNRHMLEINMTFNPLKDAVFKDPLVVKNGWIELNDKPGYGVEVIDNIEKKFPWNPGNYKLPRRFQRDNTGMK